MIFDNSMEEEYSLFKKWYHKSWIIYRSENKVKLDLNHTFYTKINLK